VTSAIAETIHRTELVLLLLLLLAAGLTTMARRFQTPYPIVLVIAGLFLSFVPGLPQVSLNPDVVLLILLPPLLFAAATNTAWRDFRFHLVSILMLAFGLVGFTVVGVSAAANWLLPGFDWRIGLTLGAVVSTTDAIAATSIAARMGLPRRIIDVLEGESLVNDASGLLALEFAVALVTTGERPGLLSGTLQLLMLLGGGIVIGLLVAWAAHLAQKRIIDPPIEITLSLIVPYIAYLLAEQVHASGALAVVVCGLYLGRKNSELYTSRARLEGLGVWNTLDFILNGTVFIVIGLQLRTVLADIHSISHWLLFRDAAIVSLVVIGLRLFWIYPGTAIAYLIRRHLLHQKLPKPTAKSAFIIGWTGMRGVLALAAAISIPRQLDNGNPFPQRSEIIFLTYSVILVTLVLQGLTLPAVIRALGLAEEKTGSMEEQQARHMMLTAAVEHLEKIDRKSVEQQSAWEDISRHYQQRLSTIQQRAAGERSGPENALTKELRHSRQLTKELRTVERASLQQLYQDEKISDTVLRKLERELDLLDARFTSRM
jgi:CPA1 family monovalent cation:H+ antiporter